MEGTGSRLSSANSPGKTSEKKSAGPMSAGRSFFSRLSWKRASFRSFEGESIIRGFGKQNRRERRKQSRRSLISVLSVTSCWTVLSLIGVVDGFGKELGNPFRRRAGHLPFVAHDSRHS